MLTLGVAGNLGADYAGGIAIVGRAANLADARGRQPLDVERAGARAIVRADRMDDIERHESILKGGAEFSPPGAPTATRPQAAQARFAGMRVAALARSR